MIFFYLKRFRRYTGKNERLKTGGMRFFVIDCNREQVLVLSLLRYTLNSKLKHPNSKVRHSDGFGSVSRKRDTKTTLLTFYAVRKSPRLRKYFRNLPCKSFLRVGKIIFMVGALMFDCKRLSKSDPKNQSM